MGAPNGNHNALLKHGLSAGRLPPKTGYVVKLTARLSRAIVTALEQRGRTLGIYEEACVNTAIRWERHSLLCQRWLRTSFAELNPDQRLAYSREIARGSMERDKCLERLGLHKSEAGRVLDALYGPAGPIVPDEDGEDARQETLERSGGPNGSKTVQGGSAPNATLERGKPIDENGEGETVEYELEGVPGVVQKVAPTKGG